MVIKSDEMSKKPSIMEIYRDQFPDSEEAHPMDEGFSRYFIRPLSACITWILIRTPITANQVTLLHLLIATLGLVLISFYDIYLSSDTNTLTGVVPLGRLMSSNRDVELSNIKNKETRIINVLTDQEEVAYQFNKYAMVSAPVVNDKNEIIGSITVDDVVDVIEEEREEDILKLGGVGQADIYDAVFNTTKLRFSWLLVNLLTAIVASIVIGFFQASIEKVVALAVLMPIVASMGGNAGTQTLTVSVRALATKELTPSNTVRIVAKETFVGGINGIIFAILTGFISSYWFSDPQLGIVIAFAMILNLLVAGMAGTLIPITLNKLKIDPALASGVILTTITDVFGFLSFLGLASIFII